MASETDEVSADWDRVQPPQKGGGKRQSSDLSLFMKLMPRPGNPYRFRLACTPIQFLKHSWAFRSLRQWPISPAKDIKERDLDVAWSKGKFQPRPRYAAFVFDRENNNRIRIIEEGGDVFGPIGNHAHLTKTNPASKDKGLDWIVEVTEDADKKRTYMVTMDIAKGSTPLTAEELAVLENPKFQRSELENRYFKKSTPEEIKDLLEQLPEPMRINKPRDKKGTESAPADTKKTAQTEPAAQPAPAARPAAAAPAAQATSAKPQPQAAATKLEPQAPKAVPAADNFLKDPEDLPAPEEDGGPTEVDGEEPVKLF